MKKDIENIEDYNLGEAIQFVLNKEIDFNDLDTDDFIDVLTEAFWESFVYFRAKKVRNEQSRVSKYYRNIKSKCDICGINDQSLELHHIIPVMCGGTNNEDNIQMLCHKCHMEAHYKKD